MFLMVLSLSLLPQVPMFLIVLSLSLLPQVPMFLMVLSLSLLPRVPMFLMVLSLSPHVGSHVPRGGPISRFMDISLLVLVECDINEEQTFPGKF